MPKSEVSPMNVTPMALARQQATREERMAAFAKLLQLVDDPRCPRPIPLFMQSLPWQDDEGDVSERIIAQLLSGDDPYALSDAGTTVAGKDLIGRKITAHDLRVRPSDKPGGWGAYLLLDCSVDDHAGKHVVVTVGAKQAVAVLGYAWSAGDFPINGTFYVASVTAAGNEVLGFQVEQAF